MFQRLEKEFDLPPVLIDARNGGGSEAQGVGQKREGLVGCAVVIGDASEAMGAVAFGLPSGKVD